MGFGSTKFFRQPNSGRISAHDKNGGKLSTLLEGWGTFFRPYKPEFCTKFKPEAGFIALLDDDAELCNEFSTRAPSTCRPVIRRD